MWIFVANSFLAAFLLFQIQPLVGKLILPDYGGASSVWNACLLFFQLCLLAGYSYASGLIKYFRVQVQAIVHLSLVSCAALWLVIWKWRTLEGLSDPVSSILLLLSLNVGAPVVLLAATSPLLQFWYRQVDSVSSPYRLYSYSNMGSLLALLSYPFFVERYCPLNWQSFLWGGAFLIYALLCAWMLRMVFVHSKENQDEAFVATDKSSQRPKWSDYLWWTVLSACGVGLLLSATNEICRNIAPIALLWVVPLVIYLLTFIITFRWEEFYHRSLFGVVFIFLILGNVLLAVLSASSSSYFLQVLVICLTLMVGCMICHGELVRSKPDSSRLASFYFALSLGGAIGGMFVTLLAPLIFDRYYEWSLVMFLCCILILLAFRFDEWKTMEPHNRRRDQKWTVFRLAGLLGLYCLIWGLYGSRNQQLVSTRNFYGVVSLRHLSEPVEVRQLVHSATVHGSQPLEESERRSPTCYYGPKSGVGLAIDHVRKQSVDANLRLGIIGMGVGTLATYMERGDSISFFEINPAVVDLAETDFSYVNDSVERGVDVTTQIGDGRLLLQKDETTSESTDGDRELFDILVVDAFSGDSVPVHLLTRECFEIYWRRVKPDGILAIHISNHMLDFEPVLRGQQLLDGVSAAVIISRATNAFELESHWVLLSRDDSVFNDTVWAPYVEKWNDPSRAVYWTDNYSSITQILKW